MVCTSTSAPAGCSSGLPTFLEALRRAAELARLIPGLEYVNVGGGLGIPLQEADLPVDLEAYTGGLAQHLGPLGVSVSLEPGDFLVKDAALLLVEVVTVEDKRGVRFVGVDCGFNAYGLPSVYHYHQEVVLCRAADAPPVITCTVAGHINEAGDLFAESLPAARGAGGRHPGLPERGRVCRVHGLLSLRKAPRFGTHRSGLFTKSDEPSS